MVLEPERVTWQENEERSECEKTRPAVENEEE